MNSKVDLEDSSSSSSRTDDASKRAAVLGLQAEALAPPTVSSGDESVSPHRAPVSELLAFPPCST